MSSTRPHFLVVDGGNAYLYASPMGVGFVNPDKADVSIITGRASLKSFLDCSFSGALKNVVGCDLADERFVKSVVADIQFARPIDRILCLSEPQLVLASQIRDSLGVPGMSSRAVLPFRDKLAMKELVGSKGLRVPDAIAISEGSDLQSFLQRHQKIVLKPRLSMGSQGVRVIESESELMVRPEWISGVDGPWEAEQFIDGAMYHIDSIVSNGRVGECTVSKYSQPTTGFQSQRPLQSAMIDAGEVSETLTAFNTQVISAFGSFSGVTHLEAFLSDDGQPVFCEIAARPGGAGVRTIFERVHGIDLCKVAFDAQIGLAELPRSKGSGMLGGWVVFYASEGIIEEFSCELLQQPWVVKASRRYEVGDSVPRSHTSGLGILLVCVEGRTSAEVQDRLQALVDSTSIKIRAN